MRGGAQGVENATFQINSVPYKIQEVSAKRETLKLSSENGTLVEWGKSLPTNFEKGNQSQLFTPGNCFSNFRFCSTCK